MKIGLLAWLACPDCGAELKFVRLDRYPRETEDLPTGTLACRGCSREFFLKDGIPQLYPKQRMTGAVRRTQRGFAWEWLRYPGSLPEDPELFLEETQIQPKDWKGKVALDVGCGMGRYAVVSVGLGAQTVAFDLSDALTRLIGVAREHPRLHLVQGDLLSPPFKPGVFDIVYSQGVLHHTADTRAAFLKTAPLARKGGLLSVWVYGTPGSWASFSTNPLRPGRAWLRSVLPFVWLVVWTRRVLSDCVRVVTTRLPVALTYLLCFPLAFLGMLPLAKYLTFSIHPRFRVRLIENFDWLAPPYQWKHTKEELGAWFSEAGFEVAARLAHGVVPKVGALGRRR